MTDPIPTTDARKALSDVGDTPRVTTTIAPAAPAAPPPSSPGLRDNFGVSFDPVLHGIDRNGNPILTANGRWAKKRGNGGRRNLGKEPTGFLSVKPPSSAAAAPPAPVGSVQPNPHSAPVSSAPPPAGAPPPAAAAGVVHDATVELAPQLTEEDYRATGQGVRRGLFALARLQFGPAWKEEDDEAEAWSSALTRLWHHYQLPRLGVIAELAVLIGTTIAKRREDARTKEGFAKLKAWFGIGVPKIKADDQVDGTDDKKAA
jgi:hypothetical protein